MTPELAKELRQKWDNNKYEIHKRPPFRAHSFDNNNQYYVVGSSCIAVVPGFSSKEQATIIADMLNEAE